MSPQDRCVGCGGRHDGASHADAAERIALAIVNGQVPADLLPLVFEDLRMHLRAREVQQAADALAVYRAGGQVWAWPATAPWAGFGDGVQSRLRGGRTPSQGFRRWPACG